MMDQKHGQTCNCPGCRWSYMKTHSLWYHVFKKLFVLIVIVFAFWMGTKLGELRGLAHELRAQQYMQSQSADNLGQ